MQHSFISLVISAPKCPTFTTFCKEMLVIFIHETIFKHSAELCIQTSLYCRSLQTILLTSVYYVSEIKRVNQNAYYGANTELGYFFRLFRVTSRFSSAACRCFLRKCIIHYSTTRLRRPLFIYLILPSLRSLGTPVTFSPYLLLIRRFDNPASNIRFYIGYRDLLTL